MLIVLVMRRVPTGRSLLLLLRPNSQAILFTMVVRSKYDSDRDEQDPIA
jgi:hypothetical protein